MRSFTRPTLLAAALALVAPVALAQTDHGSKPTASATKGAVVGGAAGHMMGHHAVAGAVAGAAVGHHMRKKQMQHSAG